jgi:hypothetical protein
MQLLCYFFKKLKRDFIERGSINFRMGFSKPLKLEAAEIVYAPIFSKMIQSPILSEGR